MRKSPGNWLTSCPVLIRRRPEAPILAFHSPGDEEAPYEDALVSVERLRRRGATITVRTRPAFDHVNSWIQALPRTARWFRAIE